MAMASPMMIPIRVEVLSSLLNHGRVLKGGLVVIDALMGKVLMINPYL